MDIIDSIQTIDNVTGLSIIMNKPLADPGGTIQAQPVREVVPRQLIVTTSVVIFAIRDWSLWVLLRDSPWGPPMRLVLGTESVTDAVDRTLDALLEWPEYAALLQLKAGWQEQQVYVWKSSEQGSSVSLIHSLLLRANRDELRPNLHEQSVPSLRVSWKAVAEIEAGQHALDPEVQPVLGAALHSLRAQVQRDPEIVLRYLADMGSMGAATTGTEWWKQDTSARRNKETRPFAMKEPATGDGTLTLAEATLLYKAFFPPDEPIDLSNLRRRFLATNRLEALDEERPVRGKELDWRRVSRAYHYRDS
ncbi:MAG TPA: hypothetical protein VJ761_21710 [Ktedonobacteraceae bacterium]|nr:hypothetical protein [Ktedonobacteraceae bacterium]